jgi:hypothetical protein
MMQTTQGKRVKSPPAKKEKVELLDLAKTIPQGSVSEKGSFLQKSGVNLFYAMLGLTTIILTSLVLYLLLITPSMSVSNGLDEKTLLQERQTVFSNFLSGIERLVIAFCLPILTAILGYLFGTGVREDRNSSESD